MKELQEMREFYREHPHSKAASTSFEDFNYLIKGARGSIYSLCLSCFEFGFMRGFHSHQYYSNKARKAHEAMKRK